MLQDRQIDRLVNKVKRLNEVYEPFLIQERLKPLILFTHGEERASLRPIKKGEVWGKDFAVGYFSFIAKDIEDGKRYYLFAKTGGVEHLVSVNGKKLGMLDFVENADDPLSRVHKYLFLEGLKNGDSVEVEAYYSHLYPGTMPYAEEAHFALNGRYDERPFETVELVVFNEALKEFSDKLVLFNSKYDSLKDGFERARMEKVYQDLFKLLPIEKKTPEREKLIKAVEMIDGYFSAKEEGLPFVGLIGHSHLDTAWLWTVEETRRKLKRTLSNAVTLLKRYPEYKFFMSTVLYLKWIEEDDPDLFEEVKALVKEGRFEPNGGAWVECDGNLTGAEALCRQILRGKRYLREKLGYESVIFWLPDTFGYSAALPQILKKSGINYFLTAKLSWNDTYDFPYSTFEWIGIDGTKIPVHFNTIHSWAKDGDVQARIDGVKDPRESDRMLIAYGFGDGGGGPSDEMVKSAVETTKHFKGAKVEHTAVADFMKGLDEKELPSYFGELYLELHRGTFTVIHKLKENNRRLEETLRNAELISVLRGEREAKALTDRLYDVLLLNQFHDILPGTCIKEATDIAIMENSAAILEGREYINGENGKDYFNTLQFDRVELLPSKDGYSYLGLDGEQKTVAPYSFKGFGVGERIEISDEISFDGETVKTPFYVAKIQNGELTSLIFDGMESVKTAFNRLRTYENVPYIYDNWDMDADYTLKEEKVEFVSQETLLFKDGLLIVRAVKKTEKGDVLTTDIKFRGDTALIEFDNKLLSVNKHGVLKAYFDTNIFANVYSAETQFGYLERNTLPRDKSDVAKFEVCAHKWTDLSEKTRGISLLSDVKYGVSCKGGELSLTLQKTGTHPDPRGDQGEHFFRFGILPHKEGLSMETVKEGYCFNSLPVKTDCEKFVLPFKMSGYKSVIVETVKFGEDGGVALRLYESMGGSGKIALESKFKNVVLCNILEDEEEVLSSQGKAEIEFSPFEIKTILLK